MIVSGGAMCNVQCAKVPKAIVQRWCKFIACRWLLNAHAHTGAEAMQSVLLQKHKLCEKYENFHWNARECKRASCNQSCSEASQYKDGVPQSFSVYIGIR